MLSLYKSRKFILFVGFLIIIPFACVLEESPRDTNLTAENLSRDVLENPDENAVLGQIIASAEGALRFEMVSSNPIGALHIDPELGTLLAAMPEMFDFEERNEITGVVRAISEAQEIDVNVTFQLVDEEAPIEDFNRFTKTWKTDKFSWNGIFSTTEIHSCRLDDRMSLSGTGSYTYDGGTLCGELDNQQFKTGTWLLDEKLRFIIFDMDNENELKVNIDHFENGRLSLSTTYLGQLVSGEYIQ